MRQPSSNILSFRKKPTAAGKEVIAYTLSHPEQTFRSSSCYSGAGKWSSKKSCSYTSKTNVFSPNFHCIFSPWYESSCSECSNIIINTNSHNVIGVRGGAITQTIFCDLSIPVHTWHFSPHEGDISGRGGIC